MRSMTLRILLATMLNVAAMAVSVVSVPVALALFVAAPLVNLSHRRVDRGLQNRLE